MADKKNGYYDFDMDVEAILIENGLLGDYFHLKDLQQRKLFLTTEVEQCTVEELVKSILQFNKEDRGKPVEKRTPIILYLASNGGEENSGFELIDAIESSKTPVYTVNLGYQYSMGFLIGLAGKKRFAMKSAKYLMHDGSNFVYNSGSKVQDQIEFQRRVEERIKDYVLSKSKITSEEYDNKLRVEWYMFADEAKEKGFVDYIIGTDCDVDEII